MSVNANNNVFSIEGKGLKLNTAEDVQEFVNSLLEMKNLEQVILSGSTFGVEAVQAIAGALKGKNSLRIVNASDIFTSRLREEIPHAVKAICDALEDKEQLIELNFSDNAFGPAGAEPMVEFLSNNRWFQVLRLNNNGLGVQGGTLIGKALLVAANKNISEGRKSSLRTIIAGRNRLENGSSQALSDAIAAHGTLTEIRMPQNGIHSEGIIILSKGLSECKNLEIIDLQDNTFTEKGSVAFAKALVEWENLKFLNIGDCLLSPKGGIVIAETLLLGHNKKLETLNLQYNEIDSKGVKILATAISTHLKNLSSLELNGNSVGSEDISVKNVRSALEDNGHEDALGEFSDEEEDDELDEEDEIDEEVKEEKEEDTEKNEEKEEEGKQKLEKSTAEPIIPTKKEENIPSEETVELEIASVSSTAEPIIPTKKEENIPSEETVELEIASVSKKLEKLPIKEDLAEPKVKLQPEAQKSEKHSIETKAVEEDKTREINKKDQKNPLVNSEDQIESITERISKVQNS